MYLSRSSRATKQAAGALAAKVLRGGVRRSGASVIALYGDLGTGKTTFAQGFLRALGVKGRITSPTFIFVRRYVLSRNRACFRHAYHFDLYRVRRAEDLRRTGFYEALRDQKAVVLIEWPEHAGKKLKRPYRVHLTHGQHEKERQIGSIKLPGGGDRHNS